MNRQHRAAVSWIASRWMGGLLLALALAVPARAQVNRWTPFGPGGGSVSSLAVDPGNPARIYAVAGGTLYRSMDGSATWTRVGGSDLRVVVLDPAHPSTLYAGGSRLYRSTDGGVTLGDFTPPGLHAVLGALAVAPGGVVFAGAGEVLLRSPDGGATWSTVSPPSSRGDVVSILVDPRAPGTVYYANPSTVFKSTDGGVSWSDLGSALFSGHPIVQLALAPSAPGTLYVLTSSPGSDTILFRSDDGAASWRQAGEIPGLLLQRALLVDPRTASTVYAAGMAGLFKSTDGGATWSASSRGLPPYFNGPLEVLALAAAPSNPDLLYAGLVEWGVGRSTSAGARWRIGVEPGLNGGVIDLLKFDPRLPDTIYVAMGYGARSFRSTDGGRTWTPFARSISLPGGLRDLAFDVKNPNVLYASTMEATWKSDDDGETWVAIGEASEHLAVAGPRTLLAGGCGLNRTTDGGRTWKEVIPCDAGGFTQQLLSLQADPAHPANVYAQFSTSNGEGLSGFTAFRSQDGGATWQSLTPGFVVAPSDFRVLYRLDLAKRVLLRSADSGKSWAVVNGHLPWSTFEGLAVDGGDANTVYIASARGLLVSRDGGKTLQRIEDSYVGRPALVTDRNHPGIVFALGRTLGGGLFEGDFK